MTFITKVTSAILLYYLLQEHNIVNVLSDCWLVPGVGEAECPGSGDPMARPAEDGDTHTAQSCTPPSPGNTSLHNTDLNSDLNCDLNNSHKIDLHSLSSLPDIRLPNSDNHFSSLRRINSVLEMLGASEGAVQHQPLQVGEMMLPTTNL